MFGWALPRRPGAIPDTNAFWAWLTSADSVEASSEMSIRWPGPGRRAVGSLAGDQRRQDAHGPEHPGHHVADRDADLGRAAAVLVRRAGDRHQAARGLDDEVVARPVGGGSVGAVAGDGEVDEARIQPLELVVVEAEAGEAAGPEVLDEDVAAAEQPAQDLGARLRLEVEPDRSLVPVDGQVVGGGSGPVGLGPDPRRPPGARPVAVGWLDLDDVRPEIAQEHRAVRPGQDRRAIDDGQSGQRPGGLR